MGCCLRECVLSDMSHSYKHDYGDSAVLKWEYLKISCPANGADLLIPRVYRVSREHMQKVKL